MPDDDLRLRTWIMIKNKKIDAVMDTGATHSCIQLSILEELNVPLIAADVDTLHLADKSKVTVEEAANLWFVMNGIVYQHSFLVLRRAKIQ